MAVKSILYTIHIPKWDEHNKSKKKNHRYFLIENRIFSDDKISQLNAEQTRLYLYLLSVASDLNTSSYTFHVRLLPSYFRVREQLLLSCLKTFESLQLLRYEKSGSNTIENKTKQNKTTEGNGFENYSSYFEKFVFEVLNTSDLKLSMISSKVEKAFGEESGFNSWVETITTSPSFIKIENKKSKLRYFLAALNGEMKNRGVL